jgi:hypothetical protein
LIDPLKSLPGSFVKVTSYVTSDSGVPVTPLCKLPESQGSAIFEAKVGEGHFIYVGLPSALFTKKGGSDPIRALVKYSLEEYHKTPYIESGDWVLKRGNYIICYSANGGLKISGPIIDIMDSSLKIQNQAVVGATQARIFYQPNNLRNGGPALIYASHEATVLESTLPSQSLFSIKGPAETPSVMRLAAGGRRVKNIRVLAKGAPAISLTPGTPEEHQHMVEGYTQGLSQNFRFADGRRRFVYKFDAKGAEGGELRVDMCNNFLVELSKDGKSWTEVLREKKDVKDGSNRKTYTISLDKEVPSDYVFVRFRDTNESDGWGPSIFGLSAEFQTGKGKDELQPWPVDYSMDSDTDTLMIKIINPSENAFVEVDWQ